MASFQALQQEMDKRSEEYDIKRLREAYFKEIGYHGTIGMHLVPSLIRPTLSNRNLKSKEKMSSDVVDSKSDAVST